MKNDKRFDPKKHDRLINEERWAAWNPPQFLARFELAPGSVVLDLGCGPGFWTLPLADVVGPQGKVYALDVSAEMLDHLAEQAPPPHVIPLKSDAIQIPLEEDTVDFAWLAFVFHEVEPPQRCLRELARVLRPGGRLAILDWSPEGRQGPPPSHRLPPTQVIAWLEEAGFSQVHLGWQNEDAYLIEAHLPEHANVR